MAITAATLLDALTVACGCSGINCPHSGCRLMRILLSEGSGLTSRQVATRLGDLGHHVELLSATRVCLTRFTRHVHKLHLVPHFGREPFARLEAASAIAKVRGIDVLFPTHE